MKKFLATLFILIILAGVAFFFGWAQLKVPPGAYGVIHSKTHGIDPRPVQSGEFRWLWYKLIPTNVEISVFRLDPVNHSISAGNTLPSGHIYAAFARTIAGTPVDFSWEINASLSFSISPDALVSLVTEHNIGSQEALTVYEQSLAEQIEIFTLRRFNSVEAPVQLLEELLANGSSAGFEQEIQKQFPMITNVSCLVRTARFPDFALYAQIRDMFITRQRELASASSGQKAIES
ncbi:MAG: hypothetical protein LBH97_02510, partial [Treponema sp.]|nr:hypothetical protein [Treponema sp.]